MAELLDAGTRRAHDVWLADSLDPSPTVDRILDLAAARGTPVRRVARSRLEAEARSDAPQGVLAHADPLHEADFDELCGHGQAGADRPLPFLLALDGVTDPHNLGALIRSAEGAGATGAVLARHRAAHITPTVAKAAAGAVEHVPMAVVGGIPAALARARDLGVWVVGLVAEGGDDIWSLDLGDIPVALVVGSEGAGLSRLARQRCDLLATIPLRGRLPALNASVAGALALFAVARPRSRGG